ncbi:hypothetical protein PHMEG_00027286, partial [Phytophthora megakarya]
QKRRQFGCKVCSLLLQCKNAWETKFYCVECSRANADEDSVIWRVDLSQKVRPHDPSGPPNSATCS